MKRCGSRCLAERRNQCRELQKWSRCLLTMIGLEQVSRRYLSKNSECRTIADMISIALTAEPEGECSSAVEDWLPIEKCSFCDGCRIPSEECSEKGSIKMETESESTTSDSEHYGTECSSRNLVEQNAPSTPPENSGHQETSGGSQFQPQYMHPFSGIYTPPIVPLMPPFVPLPELANQLYFQSFLQWSASGLLQQQLNSQRSSESLHSSLTEHYLLASKGGTLMQGKENGDSDSNHLIQQVVPSVSSKSDDTKQTPLFRANNDISSLYAGLPNSPFSSESLAKRLAAIYGRGSNGDEDLEEDQPLDLSSRRALQAATQCAVSSVLKSREGKRQRTSLKVLSNKTQNPAPPEERNDSVTNEVKNVAVHPSVNKRNYSQADLDAAVRDIRCGRLGTRRASVVYGIPRSTLRNKIYKLEAADDLRTVTTLGKRKRAGIGSNAAASTSPTETRLPKNEKCASLPANETTAVISETFMHMQPLRGVPATDNVQLLQNDGMLEADSGCRSQSSNQESPKINGERHHDSPIPESKKPLWSPFVRQQSPEPKNTATEEKKSGSSPANSIGSQSDWKRSRPKRGQYRKYNKDALDEAVRSVRRGEMSVHRAGSFYGVPHSTLEYKVKERNLMRTKRKKVIEECAFENAITDNGGAVHSNAGSSPLQDSPQQASSEKTLSSVNAGPLASTAVPS